MKKRFSILLVLILLFSSFMLSFAETGNLDFSASRNGNTVTISGNSTSDVTLFSTKKEAIVDKTCFLYDDPQYEAGTAVSEYALQNTEKFSAIHYSLNDYEEEDFSVEFQGRAKAYEMLSLSVYSSKEDKFIEMDFDRDLGSGVHLQAFGKTSDYIEPGETLEFRVNYKIAANGADKLYWITDTQYYTMLPYSNRGIYDIMARYGVDLYKNGEVGYILHTGDVVDLPTLDTQYAVADKAQSIIDISGAPNGILAGNHDVGWNDRYDYYNFQKYFGKDRYDSHYWYGSESKYDNSLNYQLITLGGRDFVFLNIGFGIENEPETIAWASDILNKYAHRTAIVSTHAYLDDKGEYVSEKARGMFDNIVVPNENVRLVLCGHWDAAFKKVLDVNGRQVIELLADYQTLDPVRYGGEGYTRTIEFADNKIINRTYSPVTGSTSYYDKDLENFELDFDYVPTSRELSGNLFTFEKDSEISSGTSPFKFDIETEADVFILESETDRALITLKKVRPVPPQDKTITVGRLPMQIRDPNEENVKVDNVNFHITGVEGNLNLRFTTDKTVVPKIVLSKPGVSVPFMGKGFYHLDRYQNNIVIRGLEAGETYNYDIHGLKGKITVPGKSDYARVAVLADPQIGDENTGYKGVMEKISGKDYDSIALLGDLTDNGMDIQAFDLLLNAEENYNVYQKTPVSVAKGNHDAPYFFQRIEAPRDNIYGQYSYTVGNMRFVAINTDYYDIVSMINQGNYLIKESKKAKENGEFLVVIMHKSLYSSGAHIYDADVVSLRKYYARIFEKAGVDLVLQGHDHVYSRARLNKTGEKDPTGVTYVTAGHAGSLKWYDYTSYKVRRNDPILPNYEFIDFTTNGTPYQKTSIYLELENTGGVLFARAYSVDGGNETLIDEFELTK